MDKLTNQLAAALRKALPFLAAHYQTTRNAPTAFMQREAEQILAEYDRYLLAQTLGTPYRSELFLDEVSRTGRAFHSDLIAAVARDHGVEVRDLPLHKTTFGDIEGTITPEQGRTLRGLPAFEEASLIRDGGLMGSDGQFHGEPLNPLNSREVSTLLAALRYWQLRQTGEAPDDDFDHIADNGGTVDPLTPEEVDDLCERINR